MVQSAARNTSWRNNTLILCDPGSWLKYHDKMILPYPTSWWMDVFKSNVLHSTVELPGPWTQHVQSPNECWTLCHYCSPQLPSYVTMVGCAELCQASREEITHLFCSRKRKQSKGREEKEKQLQEWKSSLLYDDIAQISRTGTVTVYI